MKSNFPDLIVVLDDHPITAEGLKNICQNAGWGCKIEDFTEEEQFFDFIQENEPDIFLIDLQLKETDGREVVKELKQQHSKSKVIVLSSFEDPVMIRSSFSAGADAYIIKNATSDELIEGIISIWNGDKKYFQEQVRQVIENGSNEAVLDNKIQIPRLTSREKEVLKLLVEGKRTKEIAEALFVSDKTIETHRSNLFAKLDVNNSAGAVKKTLEWGLLD